MILVSFYLYRWFNLDLWFNMEINALSIIFKIKILFGISSKTQPNCNKYNYSITKIMYL